jgi:hypothetical protein
MIPSVVTLKIHSGHKFRLSLWLPLFLVWPIALVLFLAVLPLLVIADIVLLIAGANIHIFRIIAGLFLVAWALPGTRVDVRGREEKSLVKVAVY